MNLEDMKKLATMARIDMGDAELESMAHEFDAILAYVDQIKDFNSGSSSVGQQTPVLYNVMREDVVTNTTGEYTDAIIAGMPASTDGYLKVKQIL